MLLNISYLYINMGDIHNDINSIKLRYKNIKNNMIKTYPDYKLNNDNLYEEYQNKLVKLFNDIELLKIKYKDELNVDKTDLKLKNKNINDLKDIWNVSKKDIDNVENKYHASFVISKSMQKKIFNKHVSIIFNFITIFFLADYLKNLIGY